MGRQEKKRKKRPSGVLRAAPAEGKGKGEETEATPNRERGGRRRTSALPCGFQPARSSGKKGGEDPGTLLRPIEKGGLVNYRFSVPSKGGGKKTVIRAQRKKEKKEGKGARGLSPIAGSRGSLLAKRRGRGGRTTSNSLEKRARREIRFTVFLPPYRAWKGSLCALEKGEEGERGGGKYTPLSSPSHTKKDGGKKKTRGCLLTAGKRTSILLFFHSKEGRGGSNQSSRKEKRGRKRYKLSLNSAKKRVKDQSLGGGKREKRKPSVPQPGQGSRKRGDIKSLSAGPATEKKKRKEKKKADNGVSNSNRQRGGADRGKKEGSRSLSHQKKTSL